MIASWVAALIRRRPVQFLITSLGIAVSVALLASLGAFIAVAQQTMTARASSNVAVDWQIELTTGADVAASTSIVRAASDVTAVAPVGYAKVESMAATTGGTTQQTGPGVVLGLPAGYARTFPGQIRLLTGTADGGLVAQQTAANLHAVPGDTVTVTIAGAPRQVTISGVVELPQANSLFQIVGAPAASQPAAPPDNVILLPAAQYAKVTAAATATRPDLLTTQLHVLTARALSTDPAAAYVQVTSAANNLSAKLAGAGVIGDNLAASLDAARSDASYARVLFLFLGLPGAILAALLTIAVASADAEGRRRDDGLLRVRGARVRTLAALAAGESIAAGVVGGIAGLLLAAGAALAVFGTAVLPSALATGWPWFAAAFLSGVLIAMLAVLAPAVRAARSVSVTGALPSVAAVRRPWWLRIGLDIALVVVGVVLFLLTTQTGYSLVLAPEGVATINVNYWAFLGPAFLWVGLGLFGWRVLSWLLARRRLVAGGIRALTGPLAGSTASMFGRRRGALARSAVLLGLSLAFASSTAVFNSTYEQQAEVDARLTNGSEVRVTQSAGASDPSIAGTMAAVPGVSHVEPLQHRYAYVGADLQDMYGVNPATIGDATSLQDAYFQGGTAADLLAKLGTTPDGVLVSSETVTDYQLSLGDRITLRIVDSTHAEPTSVTFTYIGVALEFPTAPHDSFLITNADYVAEQTGDATVGTYLLNTTGADPATVAKAVQARLGTSAAVTPIGAARSSIGSSLTSVDLHGLTALELAFAIVLAASAAVLVLVVGLRERRRTAAIATLMGVSRSQLRGVVLAEGATVAAGGLAIGAVSGAILSNVLVAVLTGVFDPPPSVLAVPWAYLVAVVASVLIATLITALAVTGRGRRPAVELLRET
ncbi:MAG TPA: FtsX-like permease family protein [Pseudolysinimonas sp.]|nr:FtsX-like permease family protein [Pseudolysinimonas sp.]